MPPKNNKTSKKVQPTKKIMAPDSKQIINVKSLVHVKINSNKIDDNFYIHKSNLIKRNDNPIL